MKKKTKKSSTVKRTIFTSARPPLSMSEMVAVSRVLDEVRAKKVSATDKLMECAQNDKGIPRGAMGGVLHRRDVWQGRQLDGSMVEFGDWLGEYGEFHEEVERTILGKNRFPERKWEWRPRNSYPKWLKKMKKRRVTTCLGADGFKWASREGVPKKVHKKKERKNGRAKGSPGVRND